MSNIPKTILRLALAALVLAACPSFARADEGHAPPKSAETPATEGSRKTVLTIRTEQGNYRVTIERSPKFPVAEVETRFGFRITEVVQGGLAGGELPVSDAKVRVSIRESGGRVEAGDLPATPGEEPGAYRFSHVFKTGGEHVLRIAVATSDDRVFSADLPVTVRSRPFNLPAFSLQLLAIFLAVGLVAASIRKARSGSLPLSAALRKAAPTVVAVTLISVPAVYLAGKYTPSFRSPEPVEAEAGPAPAAATFEVGKEAQLKFGMTTDEARRERLTRTLSVNGKVAFRTQFVAEVTPPVAGRLTATSRRFTIGDRVAAGTVLAVVEQTLPAQDAAALEVNRLQIWTDRARLESEISQNRKKLEQARIDAKRAENLYALQAIPLKDAQAARLAVSLAEDDLKRTTAQLETYQASDKAVSPTRRFEVRAPVSGVVVATSLTGGEYVEPTKILMKIADNGRMWVEARVFEADLETVRGSSMATFTLPGYPDRSFTIDGTARGRLVTVGAALDPQTKTIPVIFEVENRGGLLKDGMFAQVLIAGAESTEVVTVPKSAVYDDAGRKYVYVFLGGERFEQRDAVVGIETAERVELKTGLKAGDRVVVNGLRQLRSVALQGGM